jgi:hypothetical protein
MLDEIVKSLDEQSAALMELPLHVRDTMWPTCPFYGVNPEGSVYIRWNNLDTCAVLGEKFEGLRDRETVEFWSPSNKIDQAMRLWKDYPPKTQWLQFQIGESGWIVELLYHHNKECRVSFKIDDYVGPTIAHAITRAWILAMEAS